MGGARGFERGGECRSAGRWRLLFRSAIPLLASSSGLDDISGREIRQDLPRALKFTHSGFSGSAYVNTYQEAGAYVEWLVTVPKAVTATLIIRFANGTTANRPMAVRVNGAVVNPALSFMPTGGWPVWATRSLTASLHAGTNTVRLTSTTSNGGPNIDLLDVNDGTDWGKAMVGHDRSQTRCDGIRGLGVLSCLLSARPVSGVSAHAR